MDSEFSIADIDNYIASLSLQNSILHFPRLHSEHITSVHSLAMARRVRYDLSQQKEDLDKTILHHTEAILLPISRARHSIHVVQLLFHLVRALLDRCKDFDQIEDLKYSIEYLRCLQGLPLESFDIPRNYVIEMLIWALGAQVESGTGDATRNIGEMVILCRELLVSNISADLPIVVFTHLNDAIWAHFTQGQRIQLLDEVVECLRDAVKTCPPGSHLVLFELAKALFLRFMETHSNDDYDASTAAFEKILDPKQPGECPDAIRHLASLFLSMLAYVKSSFFKNPDNIEAAISRMRIELSSPFIDEELRFCITESLSVLVLGITVSMRAAKKRILMFHK